MTPTADRRRRSHRLYNRARQRALVALARRHRREYLALVAAARADICDQVDASAMPETPTSETTGL